MSKTSNHLDDAITMKEYGVSNEYTARINEKPVLEVKFATLKEDGTTVDDLIALAIGKLNDYNEEVPSRETSLAITKLEEALLWLHYRTVDRIHRAVEGTMEK